MGGVATVYAASRFEERGNSLSYLIFNFHNGLLLQLFIHSLLVPG